MRYDEKTVTLRDGRSCLLRSPGPEDAAGMLAHLKETAGETDFLTRYPEETLMTEAEEEAFLQKVLDHPRQVMLIGVVNGAIAAGASVFAVNERMKLRHRAVFGIAIVKEYWHLGLGSLMTAECIRLAREMGYEQLELQVLSGNTRARLLYEQMGFEAWGSVKNGFKLKGGSYQDDLFMGLML